MTRNSSLRDFRRRADAVRCIPLELVLTRWGAQPDHRDRSQWRTPRGPLSVTGSKFFNWHLQQGGGGAIDLVMHLSGWDARTAVHWLEQHLGSAAAIATSTAPTCAVSQTSCHGPLPPALRTTVPRSATPTSSGCLRRISPNWIECVAI